MYNGILLFSLRCIIFIDLLIHWFTDSLMYHISPLIIFIHIHTGFFTRLGCVCLRLCNVHRHATYPGYAHRVDYILSYRYSLHSIRVPFPSILSGHGIAIESINTKNIWYGNESIEYVLVFAYTGTSLVIYNFINKQFNQEMIM